MKRPQFSDLTPEQQATYGNGCGVRLIKVPDFVFSASCRHHDFNFERGSEVWYKAPYWYMKANVDFFVLMLEDCTKWGHYPISLVYFLGVTFFSWPWFTVGRWSTLEDILQKDLQEKML